MKGWWPPTCRGSPPATSWATRQLQVRETQYMLHQSTPQSKYLLHCYLTIFYYKLHGEEKKAYYILQCMLLCAVFGRFVLVSITLSNVYHPDINCPCLGRRLSSTETNYIDKRHIESVTAKVQGMVLVLDGSSENNSNV